MADLTPQERLQPSLLDRLTDNEPDKKQESREKRVLSLQGLRNAVLRDLSWLLNSVNLAAIDDLERFSHVVGSVLNYGIRDLTGHTASSLDASALERLIRQSIWDFEPRILRDTVKVRLMQHDDLMNHNSLMFEIEGDLWAQPLPVQIYLRTEIDLEIGDVKVMDQVGQASG